MRWTLACMLHQENDTSIKQRRQFAKQRRQFGSRNRLRVVSTLECTLSLLFCSFLPSLLHSTTKPRPNPSTTDATLDLLAPTLVRFFIGDHYRRSTPVLDWPIQDGAVEIRPSLAARCHVRPSAKA